VSTYRAQVRVEDGTLHTARPLFAPDPVTELVESVVYDMVNPETGRAQRGILSVQLVVETDEESQTPIGDSSTGTVSAPLDDAGQHTADDDGDEPAPAAPSPVVPAMTVPA
jgi:hypothetical protein